MAEFSFDRLYRDQERKRRIWDYEDPALIEYARQEWLGLKRNKKDSIFAQVYKAYNSKIKGRKGRLKKFPFFVYCLSEIIKNITARDHENYRVLINERPLKIIVRDRIDYVLFELYDENSEIFCFPSPDKGLHFDYSDRVIPRYKERKIVENEWSLIESEIRLEKQFKKDPGFQKLKRDMEELMPSVIETTKLLGLDDPKKIKQEIKLREKIIDYLKTKKLATQRELSNKFSKKYADLFSILFHLIHKGMVGYDEKEKKFFFITEHPKSIESQDFSNRVIPVPEKGEK